MHPFFVLDLPLNSTDEDVENRYFNLVKQYPPDNHPDHFVAIRKAYEAIRTERARLETHLFYYDSSVKWEVKSLPNTSEPLHARQRLTTDELADYLRKTDE